MAFCVLINLLSDTTTVGTKVTHIPSAVVNSLTFMLKLSSFHCRASERVVSVLSESKAEGREKFGNINLERYVQTLGETGRIQDPV